MAVASDGALSELALSDSQGRRVAILGRTPAPDLEARGVRFIRASLEDAAAEQGDER